MKTITKRIQNTISHRLGITMAVLISLAFTLFFAFAVNRDINKDPFLLLDDLEHLAADLRLSYAGIKPIDSSTSPSIIVIDIDDKSLAMEGRWPWSRQKMARLTAILQQAKVAVITHHSLTIYIYLIFYKHRFFL